MGEDESGTIAALHQLRDKIIGPLATKLGGGMFKDMGDGWLIEFSSIAAAVECALDIQDGLRGEGSLRLRIGVHIGDVTFDGKDIYGDGVNVAARLEALAEPGEILISDAAYSGLDKKAVKLFHGGQAETLKNITRPVIVWRTHGDSTETKGNDEPMTKTDSDPDKASIAVLPFENMSGDLEQDYFADGITEDIITALSRFHWLFVTARNSSFSYKGRSVDVREVSRDLGVRYVLEGSIRKAGERVRITAQLIDGKTGNHIWAEKYDRLLTDIFELQDEITAKIAAAMQPVLYAAESSRVDAKKTQDLDAWDLFLRAREFAHRGTKEAIETAQTTAAAALAMDPKSSGAARVLAGCLYQKVISGWSEDRGGDFAQALSYAESALEIDHDDAETRQILGLIYLGFRRFDEALAELRLAIELNPNYAQGYVSLGTCYNYLGEPEKALPLFDKAIEISPRDLSLTFWRCTQSLGLMLTGAYDKAIESAKFSAKRKDYWAPSRWYWAASAAMAGNQEELDAARREVLLLNPNFSISAVRKAHPFKRTQDFEVLANGLRKAEFPE